jgi:pyridoxal phosphate enzyme (YggS family)
MMDELIKTLQEHQVKLVAVTKNHPPEEILGLYERGLRAFGENRVQEMLLKQAALPTDVEWHLIGHLQTNKVKLIASFVSMIHAVDSLDLLQEINKQALKANRVIDCLLQFHIASEETKYGFQRMEAKEMLTSAAFSALKNVRICGVMGMATFTDNQQQVRLEFRTLKKIFDTLKDDFFIDQPYFKERSMGMSGDWKIAIEEGSTIVRIGSLLFDALTLKEKA